MSFEKKMKKRGNKNLNKYAKNPYHVPWYNKIPIWVKVAVPATAVFVATLTVTLVSVNAMQTRKSYMIVDNETSNNKNGPAGYDPSKATPSYSVAPAPSSMASSDPRNPQSSHIDDPIIYTSTIDWNTLSIPEKYPHFEYQVGYNQGFYMFNYQLPAIEEEYIDKLLANDVTASGGEYLNGEYVHEIDNVSIYKIKDLAERQVLAAKIPGDDHYYAYFNQSHFNPYNDLNELFTDIPLDKVVTYDKAYYRYQENDHLVSYTYTGVNKEQVMNIVFSNMAAPSAGTSETFPEELLKNHLEGLYTKEIDMPLYFPSLKLSGSMMTIYDDGCLEITIFNRHQTYYVGEEVYHNFESYILNNLISE